MSDKRDVWQHPELVTLVRGRPEEAVLGACKDEGGGHEGPSMSDRLCNAVTSGCPNCSAWAAS